MKQSNRSRLHNLPSSLKEINWEKYKTKKYLHFDTALHINHFKKYLLDEDKIKSHSFLPFINFEIKFKKYVTINKDKNLPVNKQKTKKEKTRLICYASVFCKRKVQRIATKNTECCHPIFSLFSRQCIG